jgi:hypothetical protein
VRGLEFTNGDRWFFVQMYRWFPSVLKADICVLMSTRPSSSHLAELLVNPANSSLAETNAGKIEAAARALGVAVHVRNGVVRPTGGLRRRRPLAPATTEVT